MATIAVSAWDVNGKGRQTVHLTDSSRYQKVWFSDLHLICIGLQDRSCTRLVSCSWTWRMQYLFTPILPDSGLPCSRLAEVPARVDTNSYSDNFTSHISERLIDEVQQVIFH